MTDGIVLCYATHFQQNIEKATHLLEETCSLFLIVEKGIRFTYNCSEMLQTIDVTMKYGATFCITTEERNREFITELNH